MIKKLLYVVFFAMFGLSNVNAQISFSHAGGAKLLVPAFDNASVLDISSDPKLGIMYTPRLNVIELNNSTVSLGTHFAMAFQGSFNTNGDNSFFFCF